MKVLGGAVAADMDLERRLDRFQEDARVLVDVAKQQRQRAVGGVDARNPSQHLRNTF